MDERGAAIAELVSLRLAREHFPMWTEWGVDDTSLAVHSLGLSYLLTVGQHLGYAACCEYPVAPFVRGDCVWWDAASKRPVAAFEFERLKDGRELQEKVRHLLVAANALGESVWGLGLVFWSKVGFPARMEITHGLRTLFRTGFRDGRGRDVPGADPGRLVILECQHRETPGGQVVVKRVDQRWD